MSCSHISTDIYLVLILPWLSTTPPSTSLQQLVLLQHSLMGTIHSAAHINKKHITDTLRKEWGHMRIFIVDRISFFEVSDMNKLDCQLKKLTGRYNISYVWVTVVFSRDFHQLQPICSTEYIFYYSSPGAASWENTINCTIIPDNSHRFKNDPKSGDFLGRMRMGTDNREG